MEQRKAGSGLFINQVWLVGKILYIEQKRSAVHITLEISSRNLEGKMCPTVLFFDTQDQSAEDVLEKYMEGDLVSINGCFETRKKEPGRDVRECGQKIVGQSIEYCDIGEPYLTANTCIVAGNVKNIVTYPKNPEKIRITIETKIKKYTSYVHVYVELVDGLEILRRLHVNDPVSVIGNIGTKICYDRGQWVMRETYHAREIYKGTIGPFNRIYNYY